MDSTLIEAIIGALFSGGAVAAFFNWLLKRKIAEVNVRQGEASLADQIGESASSWIKRQDERSMRLERELGDSRREVQQLREELGKLSQELNAFRLGIAAPLGYVIVPRLIWEQTRRRDEQRQELPATRFPGEDVNDIVRDVKDPPEGGGV